MPNPSAARPIRSFTPTMENNSRNRKGNDAPSVSLPYRGRNVSEHGFPVNTSIRRGRREGNTGLTRITSEQYLSDLFREQSRLQKSISRQGRLLKVDPRGVISVDTELHRQVTNEIIRVSADLASFYEPGQYNRTTISRKVAPDQEIFDQMYSRQGLRSLGGMSEAHQNGVLKTSVKSPRGQTVQPAKHVMPCLQLFRLEGPALRSYLKAVDRGYLGGPQAWLRSRYCRQALPALRSKGLLGPVEQKHFGVFNPKSPLRFCLRQNTNLQQDLTKGFFGETLVQYGNLSVLSRQKGQPLASKDWPSISDKKIWPSTPTLFESWQACVTGSEPVRHYADNAIKNSITIHQLRSNSELMKRVARANVLGIRAWVPLPEKLRWYFKYRWGFLILRPKVPLSVGVADFLLSLWKKAPNQCFLLDRVSLRYYLKLRMPSRFITESAYMDVGLRNFLNSAPPPRGEGAADTVRPTIPVRFVLQRSLDLRHLEKDTGGVRLDA